MEPQQPIVVGTPPLTSTNINGSKILLDSFNLLANKIVQGITERNFSTKFEENDQIDENTELAAHNNYRA